MPKRSTNKKTCAYKSHTRGKTGTSIIYGVTGTGYVPRK